MGNNDIRDRGSMTTFQLTKRDRPSSFPKSDRSWRSYPKQWQF
ncbi:hypothetical protein VL20_3021 [Microcystis panniformis FACHB-1757]|uniref:Uncharacterized protein n=1 Tax=Microcystis panniformis FACHB-1757 TaxID=1638788 RepID=A0A0K1S1N0_9CHRO|nr:hypothetical protein VL20_3021 [Microcystis panniformis FACHB-1757]